MSNPSSGTSTPPSTHAPSQTSSSLSYPETHIANSLYRRLTDPSPQRSRSPSSNPSSNPSKIPEDNLPNGVYTPPHRNASPFQPPPLTPLTLSGTTDMTILSKVVAEEIRLLVPPRLQLAETWSLVYSLENDGVSLATLYTKCAFPKLSRGCGFILVVQDAAGGVSLPSQMTARLHECPLLIPLSFSPLPDLRRLPDRPTQTPFLLLWYRRMLPLARHRPPFVLSACEPSPSPFRRHGETGPQHHHRVPNIPTRLHERRTPLTSASVYEWTRSA